MDLAEVALLNVRLKENQDVKDLSSTFQAALEKRFGMFNLSLKDFKVNNKYDFSEETADILYEIFKFNLKRYSSNLKKGNLKKVDTAEINKLSELLEMAVKSHFNDKTIIKNCLLKINAVNAEVGIFDERILGSIRLFNLLNPKIREVAMDDIRILFLESFSKARYPNLNDIDRNELFIEFLGQIEIEVYDYMERLKEWDNVREDNKDLTTSEVRELILGDY